MPWSMWSYPGYVGLFRAGGVVHERLYSQLPPAHMPNWNTSANQTQPLSERVCGELEPCRRFYRAHSMLYVNRGALCRLLRKHFAIARNRRSACYKPRSRLGLG